MQEGMISEIQHACETFGFFYVTGHGIPIENQSEIFSTTKEFFSLSENIKCRVEVKKSRCFRGYVPFGLTGPNVPKRMLEAFQIMLDLGPDDPDVVAGSIMYGANQWPKGESRMRTNLETFSKGMQELSTGLLSAFAYALGEDPEFFIPYFKKPLTQLRLLHYPNIDIGNPEDQQGVEAHTDTRVFTILMQDDSGGLEVKARDGTWLEALSIEDTFVINIGDMMEWWTGDLFILAEHRVTNRSGHSRYSVPFFVNPDHNAIITRLRSDPEDASRSFNIGRHVERAYLDAWPRDPAGFG
jgi:isopenicillin N synthase-like dioxygenase